MIMLVVLQGFSVGNTEFKGHKELTEQDIESSFLFALVWSVGGSTDAEGRERLSEFLRGITEDPAYAENHDLYTVSVTAFHSTHPWLSRGPICFWSVHENQGMESARGAWETWSHSQAPFPFKGHCSRLCVLPQ